MIGTYIETCRSHSKNPKPLAQKGKIIWLRGGVISFDHKTLYAYTINVIINLGCSNEKNRRRLSKEIRLI